METSLTQRRTNLEEKVPDIKKTLDMVEFMQERRVSGFLCCDYVQMSIWVQEGKGTAQDDLEDDLAEEDALSKPLKTTFELNDTLYAEAELEETDTVYLWLGVR